MQRVRSTFRFHPVEPRLLLAAVSATSETLRSTPLATLAATTFASLNQGVLKVDGTSGNDSISVSGGTQIKVTLNGEQMQFPAANVTAIHVFCGAGNDTLTAGAAAPAFYALGDDGDDLMVGGSGKDTLTGGAGRNTLFGSDGDDRLNGSGGRDFIYGEGGDDRMYGNGGNDYLVGGGNIDRIWGGDGDDILIGNGQNDKLFGENGNDQLFGQDGDDQFFGGAGSDTLNGGKGTDIADNDSADTRSAIEFVTAG